MEQFEHLALSAYLYTCLQSWHRYVDDAFVAFHSYENDKKNRHINAVDPDIQFTQANISDYRLSFLDCLVSFDTDRILSVTFFSNRHTYRSIFK